VIRVLAVDDHPLMRQGIASLLESSEDIRLVAEASSGLEAVTLFEEHLPDVTLMDLQMAGLDGTCAIQRIIERHPAARILVLTTYQGDAQARRAFAAGACGYLLKNAIRRDLLDAIRGAHAGHRHIPAEVASALGQHALDEPLSARELDVLLELTVRGSNREIALALGLSEDTVKTHMKNILSKLHATDRTQAVIVAIRRGIIDIHG
jgi:DNA-binding NarL/FixJ family response regulator